MKNNDFHLILFHVHVCMVHLSYLCYILKGLIKKAY